MTLLRLLVLALSAAIASGCAQRDPGASSELSTDDQLTRSARAAPRRSGPGTTAAATGAQSGEGSLFPLQVGNSWSFRTTKGTEVSMKTQAVGALELVGGSGPNSGMMAYRMLTTKGDALDETESWQAEVDGKIVRYREIAYGASDGDLELEEYWEPYKLRVDGTQLTPGATYSEHYRETKLYADSPAPQTSAPTDEWRVVGVNEQVTVPAGTYSAVLIEKLGGTSTKRYWFVRGIGKVKEESGAQLEELTSYVLAD